MVCVKTGSEQATTVKRCLGRQCRGGFERTAECDAAWREDFLSVEIAEDLVRNVCNCLFRCREALVADAV